MDTEEERRLLVEEAKTWIGTPYHHNAMLKGIGVDCARYLEAVFYDRGLIPKLDLKNYPAQWFLHRNEENYLKWVEKYAKEIIGPPLPADVVVYKYGRCFAHGAIVIKWPLIIHAYIPEGGCVWGDAFSNDLINRSKRFYSIWEQN